MTIATISIIVGVFLLILLKIFNKGEGKMDQGNGVQGGDLYELTDMGASDDPGLAHLPGNSYHSVWYANHSDSDR